MVARKTHRASFPSFGFKRIMVPTENQMKKAPRVFVLLSLGSIALFLLFGVKAFGQPVASSSPSLTPAWTNSYPLLTAKPEQWRPPAPVFSDDGNCIAIAGNGEAQVISNQGRTLWKWNYGAINRIIVAGSLAVAPGCDAIALGGDSSYKYVWIADKSGHAIPIHLASTPLGLAFDRTGQSLAVGTGAWAIYLYSRTGQLFWRRKPDAPCCLADGFSFSRDNTFLMVRSGGSGVLRMDGSVVWTLGAWGMNAAADLRTFVVWLGPNHGGGPAMVAALDATGRELWSEMSDDPGAVITPSGDKIIARVNIDQEPPNGEVYEPRNTALRAIARDGKELDGFPNLDGRPVAISPDGTRVLLETSKGLDAIDLNGNRLYSIAVNPGAYKIAPDFSAVVVFSWGSDAGFEYFKLK